MDGEVWIMKTLFFAILLSLYLAGSALSGPYIEIYPADPNSRLFGPIEVITCTDGDTVGTDCGDSYSMYGSIIEIASGTVTLPTMSEGMWACVKATSAAVISIDLQSSDHWELDGVTLADGYKISSPGVDDDTICFYSDSDNSVTTVHNPDSFTNGG